LALSYFVAAPLAVGEVVVSEKELALIDDWLLELSSIGKG
jgi:hypothetical protein